MGFQKKIQAGPSMVGQSYKGIGGVNNGEGIVEIGTGKGEEKDQ